MIRQMKIKDYHQIIELWNSIDGMGLRSIDDSREGILKYLRRNPKTCFVCDKDGIKGTILAGHDGRRGYIYHLAVSEALRGRGMGKQLVDVALKYLKEEGIHKVALVVYENNNIGNDFWEKYGFTKRPDLTYRNLSLNEDNE